MTGSRKRMGRKIKDFSSLSCGGEKKKKAQTRVVFRDRTEGKGEGRFSHGSAGRRERSFLRTGEGCLAGSKGRLDPAAERGEDKKPFFHRSRRKKKEAVFFLDTGKEKRGSTTLNRPLLEPKERTKESRARFFSQKEPMCGCLFAEIMGGRGGGRALLPSTKQELKVPKKGDLPSPH